MSNKLRPTNVKIHDDATIAQSPWRDMMAEPGALGAMNSAVDFHMRQEAYRRQLIALVREIDELTGKLRGLPTDPKYRSPEMAGHRALLRQSLDRLLTTEV